ncbi:ABC transporter permease [Marinilabilia salmonicolor]|uniref:ABC transporter permease n=1 Tax=Marinilabilia salmonicolor TaxID=989 RepID=UPI000469F73A|nr:ABC transporter permease [Marinilabilia salmonicolor]
MNSDLKNNSNPAFSDESLLSRFSSFFYYISKVGQYEARILWRSWLFRIFSLLILAILVLFDVFGVLGIAESEAWSGRYMRGGVFYMDFYLFTVAQVVIAAFLSADFLGRERKMDTTEVFYTRPMSNVQYVLGKTWGALMVFMGLNMVVALLAMVVTLISPDAVFVWQAIFIYPFIFSLPSLVFILGFSFVLMVLVRNQAVTFVLVLGFGGMVLFYLGNMHWGVWDFIGFFIPGYYSGFSGLSNTEYLLFQRGGYFLLGLMGILLTAFCLPRLPGTRRRSGTLLLFCVILLSGAAFLFFNIVSKGIDGQQLRERIRRTDKLLPALPAYSVDSCYLRVHHNGNNLVSEAHLFIKEKSTSDTLFLHLNPGFDISSVTLNNQQVPFTFSEGIISVATSLMYEKDVSGFSCSVFYTDILIRRPFTRNLKKRESL